MAERDAELTRLMAEAHGLLLKHDYAAALKILDRADKDYPHQRDVLAARELCLKQMGRQTFAFGSEQKDRTEFSKIADAVTWDRSDVVERSKRPRRRIQRSISDLPPPMFDPMTNEISAPAPYVYEAPKSKPIVPLILLLGYALSAFYLATRDPAPGQVEYFANIPFVWIPPASSEFLDGSGLEPTAALNRGFWLSQMEITIPEWELITSGRVVESDEEGPLPKSGVSFLDAEQFARALSRVGEGTFRIPRADEWTWAAAAGEPPDSQRVPLESVAWYFENSDSVVHHAGQLLPNRWKLYDMVGNLEEWVDSAIGDDDRTRLLMGGSYLSSTLMSSPLASVPADFAAAPKTAGVRLLREADDNVTNTARTLRFPEHEPVGRIEINGVDAGEAVGSIAVLEDDQVGLTILAQHPSDLSWMNGLGESDLYSLRISNPRIGSDNIAPVARLKALSLLDLTRSAIDDHALGVVTDFAQLRSLILDGTALEGHGILRLQHLTSLRTLSLRGIQSLDADDVPNFENLDHLERLDLTGSGMTTSDLTAIQLEIPHCIVIPEATDFTLTERVDRASLGGEYKLLLHQFQPSAPPDRVFVDDGYVSRTSLGSHTDLMPGYWVYVRPYWYVWKYRGIAPVPGTKAWAAENAVGEAVDPAPTDGLNDWAPQRSDESPWLLVEIAEWIEPGEIEIHWSGPAHGIENVQVFSESGETIRFALAPQSEPVAWGRHRVQLIAADAEFERNYAGLVSNRVRINFKSAQESEAVPPFAIDAITVYSRFGRSLSASIAASSSHYVESDNIVVAVSDDKKDAQEPMEVQPPRSRGLIGLIESLSRRSSADAAP